MPSPKRISVTYKGRSYSGHYICTPDGVVKVGSAYGSDGEDLDLSSDEGPKAQAERMLEEIVRKL